MANWTTPKFNWAPNDVIGITDFDRIEENTQYLYDRDLSTGDHLRNYISDFEVYANSKSLGVYEVRVYGGVWSDTDGNFVDWGNQNMIKDFVAGPWAPGDGNNANLNGGGSATNKWHWVYALYNPDTNAHDFAIDDNAVGANLGPADPPAVAGYTLSRKICPVLTTTHIAVQGFLPMVYTSKEGLITYGGLDTARTVTVPSLSAGVASGVSMVLPGGETMSPVDTVNGVTEGGTFALEVTVSNVTNFTMWQDAHFGNTFYSGVGPQKYFANVSDIIDFSVAIPAGFMYMHSTAINAAVVIMRTMTYSPDILP